MINEIYPFTIIKDRYGGIYSGGEFTAWNDQAYNIPIDISDDDTTCMNFWSDHKEGKRVNSYGKPFIISLGDTIENSIIDLKIKLAQNR